MEGLIYRFGAYDTNVAVLSNFFVTPWTEFVDSIKGNDRLWLMSQTASTLRVLGRFAEAIEILRELELEYQERFDWQSYAITLTELAETSMLTGDLQNAAGIAQRAVERADTTGDWHVRILARAACATAAHQSGNLEAATRLFSEAESLQARSDPAHPILHGFAGFRYCDLLLDQDQNAEVLRRVAANLGYAQQLGGNLAIGINHLILGRAYPPGSPDARSHLDHSVATFRQIGFAEILALALLARATDADLAEAYSLASRSGMRLVLADYHLIQARRLKSLDHLNQADALIRETGYHRRDAQLNALRAELSPPSAGKIREP
jgi:hypothetical protein